VQERTRDRNHEKFHQPMPDANVGWTTACPPSPRELRSHISIEEPAHDEQNCVSISHPAAEHSCTTPMPAVGTAPWPKLRGQSARLWEGSHVPKRCPPRETHQLAFITIDPDHGSARAHRRPLRRSAASVRAIYDSFGHLVWEHRGHHPPAQARNSNRTLLNLPGVLEAESARRRGTAGVPTGSQHQEDTFRAALARPAWVRQGPKTSHLRADWQTTATRYLLAKTRAIFL